MPKPSASELQEMVDAGIISSAAAADIENWYGQKNTNTPNRFNLVLGLFGSLLVGLGIILVIAHNWDSFNRVSKTILAFLPLALSQALCLFVLLKRKGQTGWAECSALLLFFSVAACMALISQIYHVGGTLSGFLFTWLLLSLPIIYIMPSSAVSLLYLCAATWYAVEYRFDNVRYQHVQFPYYYVLFLLLAVPHYILLWKQKRQSNFLHLHNWVLVISLPIVLGCFVPGSDDFFQWAYIGFITLFSIFYLVGSSSYFSQRRVLANPFFIVGILGIITILMAWSFDGFWSAFVSNQHKEFFFSWDFSWICMGLLLVYVFCLFKTQKNRNLTDISPVAFSVIILIIAFTALLRFPGMAQLLINIWVLIIGLSFIRAGARRDHLGILNFGLLIILLLAVLRFFDDSIPFLWRGLFFLATGAGFFIANYLLLKKRKQATIKNNPL